MFLSYIFFLHLLYLSARAKPSTLRGYILSALPSPCPLLLYFHHLSTGSSAACILYIVVILFETASGLRVFIFKYSLSIIKQGGNDGYTYEKFSMVQVVGIVNARW